MLIKLWDWEKGWLCTRIFEGHTHYVMQIAFNLKDTNTFASVFLDCKIKVREENGEHEEREQEVEADDSTNGAAIVSGNDDDDEWALTSFE
ncbi:coatomer subunit beta'-1-like isoform X1 [Phalaenopsis equestris]|uniref:coatomer subunit beta'-1-like isoform X1 n=1 Tax=Phalaenopsis equestris TaxID=78828 RepID=UPI0009E61A38|nr:coatomer subunit beta'-1-like isoform X1 [Phalaenopsis equestris]